jgi:hypothetical protein
MVTPARSGRPGGVAEVVQWVLSSDARTERARSLLYPVCVTVVLLVGCLAAVAVTGSGVAAGITSGGIAVLCAGRAGRRAIQAHRSRPSRSHGEPGGHSAPDRHDPATPWPYSATSSPPDR